MVELEIITLEETDESKEASEQYDKYGLKEEPEKQYDIVIEEIYIDLNHVSWMTSSFWNIKGKEYEFPAFSLLSGEHFIVNTDKKALHEAIKSVKEKGGGNFVFPKLIQ